MKSSFYGPVIRFAGLLSILIVVSLFLTKWAHLSDDSFIGGLGIWALFVISLPIQVWIAYSFAKRHRVLAPAGGNQSASVDKSAAHTLRFGIVMIASWLFAWRMWLELAGEERPSLLIVAPITLITQVFLLPLTPLISDIPDKDRRRLWFFIEACGMFVIAMGVIAVTRLFL